MNSFSDSKASCPATSCQQLPGEQHAAPWECQGPCFLSQLSLPVATLFPTLCIYYFQVLHSRCQNYLDKRTFPASMFISPKKLLSAHQCLEDRLSSRFSPSPITFRLLLPKGPRPLSRPCSSAPCRLQRCPTAQSAACTPKPRRLPCQGLAPARQHLLSHLRGCKHTCGHLHPSPAMLASLCAVAAHRWHSAQLPHPLGAFVYFVKREFKLKHARGPWPLPPLHRGCPLPARQGVPCSLCSPLHPCLLSPSGWLLFCFTMGLILQV